MKQNRITQLVPEMEQQDRITCGSIKVFPGSFYSWEIQTVQPLKISFLQTVPLCNYTILPVTVKLLETILEAILWTLFQLIYRILNDACSVTKLSFNADFSQETGKNQMEPGQESMGEATVLSHCSSLRNPWPKVTGVLEQCREGESNCWFSIFQGITFWLHP